MQAFIFYRIEMEKMNKTLQYFWSYLYDPVKGARSKTFPASLAGFPQGRFYKVLKCYWVFRIFLEPNRLPVVFNIKTTPLTLTLSH
jgi:hypothetical protein